MEEKLLTESISRYPPLVIGIQNPKMILEYFVKPLTGFPVPWIRLRISARIHVSHSFNTGTQVRILTNIRK